MINKLVNNFLKLFIIPLFIVSGGLYIFVVRAYERRYIQSVRANVRRQTVTFGAGAAGYIKEIRVRPGTHVDNGDVLFTYVNPDIEGKINTAEAAAESDSPITLEYVNETLQFSVRSTVNGIVDTVYFVEGNYIEGNDAVVSVKKNQERIEAVIEVEPEDIGRVTNYQDIVIEYPDGEVARGSIEYIRPTYDELTKRMELSIIPGYDSADHFDGTPVEVKIVVEDAVADIVDDVVTSYL